jgi:hypothetical protein
VNEPTTVVIGPLLDRFGHARQLDPVTYRESHWKTPAGELRSTQPTTIPIRLGHGPIVGELVWLERDRDGTVHAAGVVDVDLPTDLDLFFSAETTSFEDGTDVVVEAVGIVEETAQVGLRPLKVLEGRIDYPHQRARWNLDRFERGIAESAAGNYEQRRRHAHALFIRDREEEKANERAAAEYERSLPRFRNMLELQRPVLPPGVFIRPAQILRITR